MKRVGYPEDSTQSAYSSQLIRIPLSAIIFYLSCLISREATTRQCWGGDRNQLLGGGRREQMRTHTHLPSTFQTGEWCCLHQICWGLHRQRSSLCWYKLTVLSPTLSFPSFVWAGRASVEVTESGYCLARHTSELPLNSLLARLTLLIAQRKRRRGERDGVRPRGEKVVKVKFYEICLHRVLKALKEACSNTGTVSLKNTISEI